LKVKNKLIRLGKLADLAKLIAKAIKINNKIIKQ